MNEFSHLNDEELFRVLEAHIQDAYYHYDTGVKEEVVFNLPIIKEEVMRRMQRN